MLLCFSIYTIIDRVGINCFVRCFFYLTSTMVSTIFLWSYFGIKVSYSVQGELMEDNTSTISMVKNGRSMSDRTRHVARISI